MSKEDVFNPFLLWKSLYESTESNIGQAMEETLASEEYAEFLGNVQTGYLQYQQLIQGTTDTYLHQMNIPTRDEISSIASLIINVEEKIETLTDTVEDEVLNQSLSSEMNTIKSNINKLDRKLNQVLKALKNLETNAEEAAPKTTPVQEE